MCVGGCTCIFFYKKTFVINEKPVNDNASANNEYPFHMGLHCLLGKQSSGTGVHPNLEIYFNQCDQCIVSSQNLSEYKGPRYSDS